MSDEQLEVISADGTVIGVERIGSGPPLIVVHGGTADRSRWQPVRGALAASYTAYLLDRRGRGSSLNEAPGDYALAREADDVRAVIDLIDDSVFYLGHSYGALIGLELLTSDTRVRKALLYEPPFDADGLEVTPRAFIERYAVLIERGERDEALDLFYREVIGVDPAPLHALPIWQARKLAAPTLIRETGVTSTFVPDRDALRAVTTPTLVLTGTESPPVFGAAARLAVEALPHAELVVAEGQGHTMIDADPVGFIDLVRRFLH